METRLERRRKQREADIIASRIRKTENRRWLKKLIITLAVTAAAVYLVLGVLFGIAYVEGDSMYPSYTDGDVVFFSRITRDFRAGDVVLVKTTGEGDRIKRIAAAAGETVDILGGKVYVDGIEMREPYAYGETYEKDGVMYPLMLQEKEYFMLGDNRENSKDSRNFGAVREEEIDGKVMAVFRVE